MRFQCPFCKGIVSVDNSDMGANVQCGHCNKPVVVPSSRIASGTVIGDFIIMRELGRGGMGIVYLAHQISLDRPAAVKVLAANYASNTEFVVGFIKEARAAAKLNHPNIVQAYAVGDDEGIFYFAMEHIDGETMKNILKREEVIPIDQAINIIQQIAEALDYAWKEEKLIHRDIKPDNIMLTSSGRAKLADLGLAKVGDDAENNETEEVMGTPQYISPEQLTGDPLDNRTDIYSLGATFYHFLTGRFPYEGTTALEITRQHLFGTLIPPCEVNPNIPPDVSWVVEKMMAKDPNLRYQDASLLAEDLGLIKRGRKPMVATYSALIKVKNSNRIEAGSKPVPPKLRLRGAAQQQNVSKPAFTGTETVPENVSFTEAAKKASPRFQPKEKKPAPAITPKTPPAATPPPPPEKAPATESVPKPEPPKKTKKPKDAGTRSFRLGKLLSSLFLLLVLALAGTGAYLHFVKKVNWKELFTKARAEVQKAVTVQGPSPFMKEAVPLLEAIRKAGVTDKAGTLSLCDAFLGKSLLPSNDEEKKLFREILEYYSPLDEEKVELARVEELKKYEAELAAKRQAAAEEAKRKVEEEKRRAEEEVKRKAEEEKRRAAEAQQREKEREITNYKNRIAGMQRETVLNLVRFSEKDDEAGLRALFEKNAAEMKTAKPHLAGYARDFVNYSNQLYATMKGAWELNDVFTNGNPEIVGLTIEIRFNLCKVKAIREGVIYGETQFGKELSIPVKQIVTTRPFRVFSTNAAARLKKLPSLPYYFFWLGEYRAAKTASEDTPQLEARFSAFLTDYLKVALTQSAAEKAKVEQKFGFLPEYQRLVPKPAPKPPAPAPKPPAPAPKPPPKPNPAPQKK